MRAALLYAAFASACGASSPPAAPVASRMEPAPRDTPPPTLVVDHKTPIHADGLPAVARGGEVAVVAVADGAGGAPPGLHIEVRDRTDKVVQRIEVAAPVSEDASAHEPSPAFAKRIADANHDLAVLHGLHDLVAMKPLEIQPPTDNLPHLAMGDGLDVDWSKDHLHIFRHNAQYPLVTVKGAAWLAPPTTSAAGPCDVPAFLHAAYHRPDINLVVVELDYRTSDACAAPSPQWHVVTW